MKEAQAKSLELVVDEAIVSTYGKIFAEETSRQLKPVEATADISESLIPLFVQALRALIPNEFSTGLIVAGYSSGADYPSVASVDVDGYLLGKLKYSDINDGARISSPELGYAVSFAQTDVIERLLGGADPRFVNKTAEFLSDTAAELAPLIVDVYASRASKKRRDAEVGKISGILSEIEKQYTNDTAPAFRKEFREEFECMIALMPKLELIELAEALISITAIERKATPDEGTVGGPIDVALITKHEGFVWIKRKHYFKAALNPRYFWRKYRQTSPGGET